MSEETKKIIRQVKINDNDYNIYAEHAQDSDKTTYDSYGNLIKVSDYETKNDAAEKLTEAKGYTDTKIQEIIDNNIVDDSKIEEHNVDETAHAYIQSLISDLQDIVTQKTQVQMITWEADD